MLCHLSVHEVCRKANVVALERDFRENPDEMGKRKGERPREERAEKVAVRPGASLEEGVVARIAPKLGKDCRGRETACLTKTREKH